jgi:hypothetical protein
MEQLLWVLPSTAAKGRIIHRQRSNAVARPKPSFPPNSILVCALGNPKSGLLPTSTTHRPRSGLRTLDKVHGRQAPLDRTREFCWTRGLVVRPFLLGALETDLPVPERAEPAERSVRSGPWTRVFCVYALRFANPTRGRGSFVFPSKSMNARQQRSFTSFT